MDDCKKELVLGKRGQVDRVEVYNLKEALFKVLHDDGVLTKILNVTKFQLLDIGK